MLGRLAMTVEECLKAYEILAAKAFANPRRLNLFIGKYKYNHKPLQDAFKEVVEQRTGQLNAIFEQPNQKMCRT